MRRDLSPKENTMHNLKDAYRDFLGSIEFTWNVVVEPEANTPYDLKHIKEKLRLIEFELNKRHVGCRFKKAPVRERFWFACFEQGDGHGRHVHALLHVPNKFRKNDHPLHRRLLLADLRWLWLRRDSFDSAAAFAHKYESLRIYARPVQTNRGSVIYNSRFMDRRFESERFFFLDA